MDPHRYSHRSIFLRETVSKKKSAYPERSRAIIFRVLEDTQTALMEYEAGKLDTVILSGEQVDANKDVPGYVDRLQGYLFYLSVNINHYGE